MAKPTQIIEGQRSVLNNSGSDIAVNTIVIITDVADHGVGLPAAATSPCYGVTLEAIADGYYGSVQTRGIATCRAHGALATRGVRLMPTTAGRVDTHTTTNSVFGILLTEASAQDDIVMVEMTGPGATGT